ncbi:MAG: hypothetical protein CMI09_09945 [Oceanospirillaceae bacterium]|nr:hypothetical protein [Oceanospirillaceae bacterium]|tara:strand:+ start:401 stop:1078 length:678 start_codon:yes stop_codon:yes gene_type:complete
MSASSARSTTIVLVLGALLTGCGGSGAGDADQAAAPVDSSAENPSLAQSANGNGSTTGTTAVTVSQTAEEDGTDNADSATEQLNQQFWQAMGSDSSDAEPETLVTNGFSTDTTDESAAEAETTGLVSDSDESSDGTDTYSWWDGIADQLETEPVQDTDSGDSDESSFAGDKQALIAEKLARLNLGATIENGISVNQNTPSEYAENSYAVQPQVQPEDVVIQYLNQ